MSTPPPASRLDEFRTWLEARGISGMALAVYQAGAERVLARAGAGPMLPAHVEAAALAAQTAGAAPGAVENLRKIGAAFMAYQRERLAAGRPQLLYCNRCKMSYDRAKSAGACPYCKTWGFAGRMNAQIQAQERARDQVDAMKGMAAYVAGEVLGGVADAAAGLALDVALPSVDGDVPDDGST